MIIRTPSKLGGPIMAVGLFFSPVMEAATFQELVADYLPHYEDSGRGYVDTVLPFVQRLTTTDGIAAPSDVEKYG